MELKIKDIVIPKNKKILFYNKPCMIVQTYTSEVNIGGIPWYSLFELSTGDVRGSYHTIDEMNQGCNLELVKKNTEFNMDSLYR